jgi:hypothetical protein
MPFFKGEVKESPRNEFLYWSDDGDSFAVRIKRWKMVFKENNEEGASIWRKEFTSLRGPKIFDLLADPFERGDGSLEYDKWMFERERWIFPDDTRVWDAFGGITTFSKTAMTTLEQVTQAHPEISGWAMLAGWALDHALKSRPGTIKPVG